MSIESLMQPGGAADSQWEDLALCEDDPRFYGQFMGLSGPTARTAIQLRAICAECEVINQCRKAHDFDDVSGVWAAGSWREHANEDENELADTDWAVGVDRDSSGIPTGHPFLRLGAGLPLPETT